MKREQSFAIIGVYLHSTCDPKYKKSLKDNTFYSFDNLYIYQHGEIKAPAMDESCIYNDFYGKNIKISAIVGKNGSGKSSVLELIYRAINNIAFVLVSRENRPSAEYLYYIDNLVADLYFTINDETGKIECDKDNVTIRLSDKKSYAFCKTDPSNSSIKSKEILKQLFYTIVTNYSIQSFISNDYKSELAINYIENENPAAIWIDGLFHKNDGYITPIVFNPYRANGILDLNKEYNLTNYRLSALLIEAHNTKKVFLEGYKLNDIEYKINEYKIKEKFTSKNKSDNIDNIIQLFIYNMTNNAKRCYGQIILERCNYRLNQDNKNKNIAFMYLIHKILSIAAKYPSYTKFYNTAFLKGYASEANKEQEDSLIELINTINTDNSHITIKIKQIKHYIASLDTLKMGKQLECDFKYSEYSKAINAPSKLTSLSAIMEYLPPSFYDIDIKLDQTTNGKKTNIPFNRTSSGERQFVYTMTTLIYHIKNILSIKDKERASYRNINLVLDEIEICFHPEYQRLFINQLVSFIKRLKLNTHCNFNIIIATHSPFILSDIPSRNILYLEDGDVVNADQFKNPFGANINDILYQSFFLNNGFMGEFAKNKIVSLLRYLSTEKLKNDVFWNKTKADQFIEIVGEPIIQDQLRLLFNEKFN